MNNIEIVEHYFEISNNSNFDEIIKLFKDNSTYSSKNTGLYLGVSNIIEMQKKFHNNFSELNWDINSIEEIKDGIIHVEFTFSGIDKTGEKINYLGDEFLIIFDGLIQHIEIK